MCQKCNKQLKAAGIDYKAIAPGPGNVLLQVRRWRQKGKWHYSNYGVFSIANGGFIFNFPEGETLLADAKEFPELECLGSRIYESSIFMRVIELDYEIQFPPDIVHVEVRQDGIWLVVDHPEVKEMLQRLSTEEPPQVLGIEFVWKVVTPIFCNRR